MAMIELPSHLSTGARGIEKYSREFCMTSYEMLHWLKSKDLVLDVGAGGGLLHKEINLMKIRGEFKSDITIIPLDIIYGTKAGFNLSEYFTPRVEETMKFTAFSGEIFTELNQAFNRDAIGGSFDALPFKDGAFDGVLASCSFGIHSRTDNQLLSAYQELYRVLKNGGEAYVSVNYDPDIAHFRGGIPEDMIFYDLEDLPFKNANLDKGVSLENGQIVDHWFLRLSK